MLSRLAMRLTAAALGIGSKTAPSAHLGVASGLPQRAGAAKSALLPSSSARSLFGASWARSASNDAASGQPGAHGAAVVAQSYAYDAVDAPAAEILEVDFDPAAVNSVRLMGNIGSKKELKVFERSKLLPFSIAFNPDRRQPEVTEWVNVEVWGPLAERADQDLRTGDRVAVQGRLKIDRWEDRVTGMPRTGIKLVAASISKVRAQYPMQQQQDGVQQQQQGYNSYGDQASAAAGEADMDAAPWDPPRQQQQQPQYAAQRQSEEELWMSFFEHPEGWYDNRVNKRNPKGPDFKRKEGGREAPALWLSGRATPQWVEMELQRLDESRQQH